MWAEPPMKFWPGGGDVTESGLAKFRDELFFAETDLMRIGQPGHAVGNVCMQDIGFIANQHPPAGLEAGITGMQGSPPVKGMMERLIDEYGIESARRHDRMDGFHRGGRKFQGAGKSPGFEAFDTAVGIGDVILGNGGAADIVANRGEEFRCPAPAATEFEHFCGRLHPGTFQAADNPAEVGQIHLEGISPPERLGHVVARNFRRRDAGNGETIIFFVLIGLLLVQKLRWKNAPGIIMQDQPQAGLEFVGPGERQVPVILVFGIERLTTPEQPGTGQGAGGFLRKGTRHGW